MTICLQCGAEAWDKDRFCGNCGVALSQTGEAASSQRELASGAVYSASANDSGFDPPRSSVGSDDDAKEASSAKDARGPSSNDDGGNDSQNDEANSAQSFEDSMQPTLVGSSPSNSFKQEAADSFGARDEDAHLADTLDEQPRAETGDARISEESERESASQAERKKGTSERESPRLRVTGDAIPPGGTMPRTGFSGNARTASKPLDPGTVLNGRFEIVRRIGGGGMGAVYYAKDRNLGDAPRAVKEMIQSQLDESQHEKAIADFRRESMLLASLEHSSIPTIYDYFYDEEAGRFYLVMKYISGGDFLTRLRNSPTGRLDEITVTDWGMQIADVLNYLHSQDPPIIYRDLKPANLMIDGNSGRVMLIDFGIARWVQKEEKGVTAVGTMGYAPPELFGGKVEPRSDIYSLGATMFHLMTGSDPQDNPLLIFDFAKNPRPRQINPSISNEMEKILCRTVEYQPEGRHRSAADLRDALAAHLEKLRAGAVTYGGAIFPSGGPATTVAVEMVYCGFCRGRIAAEDVFCAHCGARQPIAATHAAARQARATAQLVVMGTTELDATFHIQKESVLVGRTDPQSNIFPDVDLSRFDPETKISRRHARIWRQGDAYLVEDLGSVNGTVVNESVRLGPRQPRTLEHGDKLRLGETTLHFLIG